MMQIEITERMCVAALEAYWGKRPYQPHKRQQWTDKELEGMHDAIKAAFAALDKDARK
jgi:hypothetical protein